MALEADVDQEFASAPIDGKTVRVSLRVAAVLGLLAVAYPAARLAFG